MSRIAIIDTAIDKEYLNNKKVEYFNLCGKKTSFNNEISHGTMCAMILEQCASDYELVNIQIFEGNGGKVFGEIELLAEALKLCLEINIDIISLSAVSSLLSDSKYIFDITRKLSESVNIVSALDNGRYITVPTSYPHVLGVRSDIDALLAPGEIAYCSDSPFCANIFANCDFDILRKSRFGPSNSFAVPLVSAFVNDLINKGKSKQEIDILIHKLKVYPINETEKSKSSVSLPEREIPVVFLSDIDIKDCCVMMDALYAKYEVQSSSLTFSECTYDIRIKTIKQIDSIQNDLQFMERHYKTDIIFIIGTKSQLHIVQNAIEIDVMLIKQSNNNTLITYDAKRELVSDLNLLERLHEILTT